MFRKLLVPLDRSSLAEQAIGPAAAIAQASRGALDLVLVHQPLPFGGFSDVPWSDETGDQSYVDAVATTLASRTTVPVTRGVMHGRAVEMICRRAQDGDADLIVLTSHGRTGLSRFWLGSVASGVLRRSAIPVLMLRPTAPETEAKAKAHIFQRLLVPLDGSALSLDILPAAADLARCAGSRIVLLRIVHRVPMIAPDVGVPVAASSLVEDAAGTARLALEAKQQLVAAAQDLAEQGVAGIESHVVVADHVAGAIIEFAADHNVDAIAMSTHGLGASPFAMGSVADKVLRASAVPILMRRPVSVGAEPPLIDAASVAQQLPALANA